METSSGGQDINVLALVKGEERYIFLFTDDNKAQMLRTLGRYASNPDLSFTWYDCAVLSQKVRQATQTVVETESPEPKTFPIDRDSRFDVPWRTDDGQAA